MIQTVGKQPLIIASAYRPPKENLEYAEQLSETIKELTERHPSACIWLSGDFNLPDIDWSTDSIVSHQYTIALNNTFISLFQDMGLQQIVDFPTRGEKTLDLFLTNRPTLVLKSSPLPGVSDHEIVLTISDSQARRKKPIKREINLWKHADCDKIKQEHADFLTRFLAENNIETPVNVLWDQIANACADSIKRNVPRKWTTTRFHQPWITRSIKRLSNRKKRSFKKAKKSGKIRDWDKYKSLKKTVQAECRKAYNNYINEIVCGDMAANPKKFFNLVKSKRCDYSGVAPLLHNGISHSDSKMQANILNDTFGSVFTSEDKTKLPILPPSPHPSMPKIQISTNGVHKLLSHLNPHKATGPDNLSAHVLKEGADALAPAMTLLFEASLKQGKMPDEWRSARVTPLFKKGERSKAGNYRPVSLTSITCKVMEHILHSQIMDHMDRCGLLTDFQHGFRKRRSCETQLLLTVHDLASGLNSGEQIDAILLDFSKAFDKVPHERLLQKLEYYGIRGEPLQWIRDFLFMRTQNVVLDGTSSRPVDVISGVPQGTVLGPLLFLVYINDLPNEVLSIARLFADDCLLYRIIRTVQDSIDLQEDLNRLQIRADKWLMSFHPQKCEVIRITNKRKIIDAQYTIHGQTLQLVDKAKYLGVTFTSKLSWNQHIDTITKKANSTRAFLQRNLRSKACPRKVKAQAYQTYVRPSVEYASTVWDPPGQDQKAKLEMVQRRAARFVMSDFYRRSSVSAMLQHLQWPTLLERRARSKVCMVYRIVHRLVDIPALPPYLVPSDSRTRGHDSRFQQQPVCIRAWGASFFPSAVILWNALPAQAVAAPSLDAFQSRIAALHLAKTH